MVLVLHSLVLGGNQKELEVYGVKNLMPLIQDMIGEDNAFQNKKFKYVNGTGTISFSLLWVKDDVSMPDGLEWPWVALAWPVRQMCASKTDQKSAACKN